MKPFSLYAHSSSHCNGRRSRIHYESESRGRLLAAWSLSGSRESSAQVSTSGVRSDSNCTSSACWPHFKEGM